MHDDTHRLLHMIVEGEHSQQDFNYRVTDAVKLARSVSAFANTTGGRLLIGVRDDGSICGVRSEEEIFMMHEAAFKYCRPQPTITFETLYAGKRTIVNCTIHASTQRPIRAVGDDGRPLA